MGSLTRFDPGTEALHRKRRCRISSPVDINKVLIVYADTDETEVVPIDSLDRLPKKTDKSKSSHIHRDAMTENERKEADRRLEILKRLPSGTWKADEISRVAEEAGVTVRTLYRWREDLDPSAQLSSLRPKRKRKRRRRLSKKVEAIIKDAIENHYLSEQKKIASKVVEAVNIACNAARLKPPSANTIRSRIEEISDRRKTKARHGAKAARDRHDEILGAFPHADYPLSVVQIDHTKLDINLVDDEHREVIGRPWLTLAIDVYSRMITGYYLTLDPPSVMSVGLCVQHSICKKDRELALLEVEDDWPVWGFMQTIHADNGKDFRAATFIEGCAEYGIDIEWRPVATPHYGGHIERMLGTVAKEIHCLPGTTFSNVQERGAYKSEAKASMTLNEMRRWLLNWITGVYHKRVHSAIKRSPEQQWRIGLLGDGKRQKGIGLPAAPENPERLRLDFLPRKDLTVQRMGFQWDHVHYFSEDLRPWIREKKGGKSIKFRVRRDPRDISRVYFLDPKQEQYVEVPYRDSSKPAISQWEFVEAKKRLKEEGAGAVNEELIFAKRRELDRIVEEANRETKRIRRAKQRKRDAETMIERTVPQTEDEPRPDRSAGLKVVVDNEAVEASENDEDTFDLDEEELNKGWREWP